MTRSRLALPVRFLVVTLSLPSIGQTSDHTRKEAFVPPMQTPSQVSTATANPAEHQITDEEKGDLYMARKQYREATDQYSMLCEQDPPNAVFLNKLGISLHPQTSISRALNYY